MFSRIRKAILLSSSNTTKSTYLWNTVSTVLNSFQTIFLLLVITRFGTDVDSSTFVMAYAVGNLVLNLGKYGMRQFQATDIQEKYSWQQYRNSRFFSCFLLIIASIIYVCWGAAQNNYSVDKSTVIILICVYKGIEAAEDVLHGRMQQVGRLDVAAKILTIRFAVFILGYALVFVVSRNLVLTTVINVAVTFVLSLVLNGSVYKQYTQHSAGAHNFSWRLLLECLPLCLGTVMFMYLSNAPKYIVDGIVAEKEQTCFNIVFMPAFVVAMFSNFIFNPKVKKIGELWVSGKINDLRKTTLKLTSIPVAVGIVTVLGGAWIGIPVLSTIYGVDLTNYRLELILFLIASGFIAVINLYVIVLTAMRQQKHVLIGYAFGSVMMLALGRSILASEGLAGLCWMYVLVSIVVALYCGALSWVKIYKKKEVITE